MDCGGIQFLVWATNRGERHPLKLTIPQELRFELQRDFHAWVRETGASGYLTSLSDASDYGAATNLMATTNASNPIDIKAMWLFQAGAGVLDDFIRANPRWANCCA